MRHRATILLLALAVGAGCAAPSITEPPPPSSPPTGLPPLTELSVAYLGFPGGLYPGGRNDPPADHAADGRVALAAIEPLDRDGRPSGGGRIGLVSVGMSNTTQEFCGSGAPPCQPWTFMGRAALDPAVDRAELDIVNGARGGQTSDTWDSPTDPNYDRVRDVDLARAGLTERQVQVAWVKEANPGPRVSLPDPAADAYRLERSLGAMVRAMKARWPNLRIVFISSRIYAGYATSTLNPEPYAYESGFSVRWVIEAQIEQERTGTVDAESGDLALDRTPWLAWGPYLWADGTNPRADGLIWEPADFAGDGTHPSQSGEQKVGRLLLDFFKGSPFTQCWFLAGRSC
jgi:hypothetical protein